MKEEYDNIERLDLILGAAGDDVNRYKLAKQADVLMLPYLFGCSGLITVLDQLGYRPKRFSADMSAQDSAGRRPFIGTCPAANTQLLVIWTFEGEAAAAFSGIGARTSRTPSL